MFENDRKMVYEECDLLVMYEESDLAAIYEKTDLPVIYGENDPQAMYEEYHFRVKCEEYHPLVMSGEIDLVLAVSPYEVVRENLQVQQSQNYLVEALAALIRAFHGLPGPQLRAQQGEVVVLCLTCLQALPS